MKKVYVLIICLIAIAGYFIYNQLASLRAEDISKATDSQIAFMLKKNSDAKEYIQNYTDYKIEEKEILTKESITAGQQGQTFREVYMGLDLEENRYLLVNLINQAGDRGLIAVIDFKKQETPNAYGILLFKSK